MSLRFTGLMDRSARFRLGVRYTSVLFDQGKLAWQITVAAMEKDRNFGAIHFEKPILSWVSGTGSLVTTVTGRVSLAGLEPATHGLGNRCSIHLSYREKVL